MQNKNSEWISTKYDTAVLFVRSSDLFVNQFILFCKFDDDNGENVNMSYDLIRIDENQDLTEENKNYMLVYVPTSIVFLSKYFYLNVLKDCLSRL